MQIVLQLLGYIHNSPQAAEKESLPFITQSIPACHFIYLPECSHLYSKLKIFVFCFIEIKLLIFNLPLSVLSCACGFSSTSLFVGI